MAITDTKTRPAEQKRTPGQPITVRARSAGGGKRASRLEEVLNSRSGRLRAGCLLVVWVALGLVVATSNHSSHDWTRKNWPWLFPLTVVVLLITIGALLNAWAKKKSAPLRAAVFLLVVFPVVALGTAGIFWMPTAGQLIALRAVVLCVLVFTPALMWWLFLATQRASLLNEFVANLDRLGLLEPVEIAFSNQVESDAARETRVSSYLQKFEATYGGLPEKISKDVVRRRFRSYSSRETRDRTSLTIAAVPVTLALVTLLIGWILVLPPVDSFPDDPTTNPRWLLALSPNATPVTFAFLGAYFFSMQMLFRRYVRGDLRGSAYVAVVLRVVLAVVAIWVLQAIGTDAGWTNSSELLILAFVIGVFPVVAWEVIRGAASRIFHVFLPSLQSRLPLNELDGLTVWHESRLEEEDIENVQNMATVDIVDLLVNTRIPAPRIIDWIDQAILLTQLGLEGSSQPEARAPGNGSSSRAKLARHGVRTASALLKAAADKDTDRDIRAFDRILLDEDGRPAVPSILSAIQTNDNLARVLRWRGLDGLVSGRLGSSGQPDGLSETDPSIHPPTEMSLRRKAGGSRD